ncbi:hypothetical protein [Rhizobium lentis]|uniref:Transmembrane protein n=1 Tax=Rhizobium lentis TaxID=1138194 RepID=A0A9Q3MAM1_9HYPH|nr:hypothetical protein [Rhizobium lentis]MBX5011459.1 hypothetical protein [Rhizobium lentis]MBX5024923.1 hypothetical protein [Rhizobium lentis]
MSQYLDENNNLPIDETTGLPLETRPRRQDEEIVTSKRRAFFAWNLMAAGIVIVLMATATVALWPGQTTDPTTTASTTPVAPITSGVADNTQ